MDEIVLKAILDERTSLYVSPINRKTYEENVQEDNLGGERGYFVLRSRSTGHKRLEILAKAPTIEAATDLFDMIVSARRNVVAV